MESKSCLETHVFRPTVPYKEWTVGAATALDHWIASRLLGLSEATWQLLLEGDISDNKLMSKGRDIIAVREALFPETALDNKPPSYDEEIEAKRDGISTEGKPELDELFDGLMNPERDSSNNDLHLEDFFTSPSSSPSLTEYSDGDIETLVTELQEYRRKQWEEGPYEEWGESQQVQFDDWLRKYVATMSRGHPNQKVDLQKTRIALLSEPPVSKQDADSFWGELQDEGRAKVLLDAMIKDGPPKGANILEAAFWSLSKKQQLNCLLNLGSLRPLLDEYTKESDRLRFLQRHRDQLLAGVELEHLVSDPSGPIAATDLPSHVRTALNVGPSEQFRLERREYGSIADINSFEKSRALFSAWNEFKSGRARYEEKMFRTNRLGLRYKKREGSKDAK